MAMPRMPRGTGSEGREERWAGRPVLAAALYATAHLIPIAASVVTSIVVSSHLPEAHDTGDVILKWIALLGVSSVALLAVDRVARRALPLAALLKLSMVFPDRAPKRLAVARRAGRGTVRDLEERISEAKALGEADEPTKAAEVILSLVAALHSHDPRTRGHSERVRWFADLVAAELRLPEADRDRLRWAALLHDVGKLRVHRRILAKPSKLSPREWKHIHRHPEEGARIMAPLAEWLGSWAETIVQHHERYDGSGYPHGLKGEEISLGGRIVSVADAYEVMTGARAYKKTMSALEARRELTRCAGTHFDPAIVRAFLNVSLGRLRWIAGPAAWLAQVPFIGWLPRLADGAAAIGGQAAGVVGAAAGAAAISSSAVTPTSPVLLTDPGENVASNPPTLLDLPTGSGRSGAGANAANGGVEVLGVQLIAPPVPGDAQANATTTTVVDVPPGLVDKAKETPATDGTANANAPATSTDPATGKETGRDTAPGISGRSDGGKSSGGGGGR